MPQRSIKTPVVALVFGLATMMAASSQVRAENRIITIAAVEPKGSATIDKEPFPTEPLPAGGGYALNKPDQTGRWEVEAYLFAPSQVIVNQDDDVTLNFVGINGMRHPITIAGYGKSFELKRGHVTAVSFKADKTGVFAIECGAHPPSMRSELVVLPRK